MGKTRNPFMQLLSGQVGGLLVFKTYKDKTVVSKVPNMTKRVLSPKQIESNQRMRLANKYAKYQYGNEERKSNAAERLNIASHKSLYYALVKEFLDSHKNMSLEEADADCRKITYPVPVIPG
jgi:hypothetical protein